VGEVQPTPQFRPNPQFARAYLRVAAKADARGAAEHRRELLTGLSGVVCEIGSGQGLNFAHYPATVTRVIAVEPEPSLRAAAVAAAPGAPVAVEVRDGTADRLPVESASCDAVVLSLVLCTLPDLDTALAEVARVLRPGGHVRFYEHVRSNNAIVALGEDLLTPVWSKFAGGCHLNRDPVAAFRAAGFAVADVRRFGFSPQLLLPPTAHVVGTAIRSAEPTA
jgi:SAM-dependent methyltransferase